MDVRRSTEKKIQIVCDAYVILDLRRESGKLDSKSHAGHLCTPIEFSIQRYRVPWTHMPAAWTQICSFVNFNCQKVLYMFWFVYYNKQWSPGFERSLTPRTQCRLKERLQINETIFYKVLLRQTRNVYHWHTCVLPTVAVRQTQWSSQFQPAVGAIMNIMPLTQTNTTSWIARRLVMSLSWRSGLKTCAHSKFTILLLNYCILPSQVCKCLIKQIHQKGYLSRKKTNGWPCSVRTIVRTVARKLSKWGLYVCVWG